MRKSAHILILPMVFLMIITWGVQSQTMAEQEKATFVVA